MTGARFPQAGSAAARTMRPGFVHLPLAGVKWNRRLRVRRMWDPKPEGRMRRMMRSGGGLMLALVVVALSAAVPAQAQGGSTPLAGTSWRLVELNGQPVVGEQPLTLVFAADEQRVSGYGGCNQFSGPYTQNGASLRFGPLASTRRACLDEALNAQETAYFAALESTNRYSIENGQLVLYRGNQVLARFAPSGG
jgi:heat shock protein HslJ